MQKRLKNKFAMFTTVHTYLKDKSTLYMDNEEFISHANSLRNTIAEIRLKDDAGKKATKGKSKNKEVTKTSVTNQALAVAGALYAFAKKSGNQTLLASMNLNKTKLEKFRDTELITELNSIKDKATEFSAEIAKYGISSAKLESYTANIETYSNALGEQDTGAAQKKVAYTSLSALFKEADDLIDSIDRFMENYKDSNPDFYAGYKTARGIRDLGIRYNDEDEEAGNPEQTPGEKTTKAV